MNFTNYYCYKTDIEVEVSLLIKKSLVLTLGRPLGTSVKK